MTKLKVKSDTNTYPVALKKSKDRHYTFGEILRLGLLLNANGEPYKDKSSISRLVRLHGTWADTVTPYGKAKVVSESTLRELNARFSKV